MKKTKINSTYSKSKITVFSIFGICIYYFYMYSADRIVNYPNFFLLAIFAIVLLLFFAYDYRINNIKSNNNIFLKETLIVRLITYVVGSYFLSGIIAIPLNFFIIDSAKNSKIEVVKCEITHVNLSARKNSIFYNFNGKIFKINGYDPLMYEVQNSSELYILVIRIRKGLLDSYLLESWDIVHR
jgi:hypothetical protein